MFCANKICKLNYPWQLSWIFTNHIALHAKYFFFVMSFGVDFGWLSFDKRNFTWQVFTLTKSHRAKFDVCK